jgi:hypothetical protein
VLAHSPLKGWRTPFSVTEADETIPISGRDWLHQSAELVNKPSPCKTCGTLRARAYPPTPNICS